MKSILHFTKWVLVWTSTLSLLMSPLAVAQSNLKVSRAQMQQAINDLGLNRQITMGEFYAKNKHLLPPRVAKQLAPMFERNKNVRMPVFEVSAAKNTRGEEVPNIRISSSTGELINIQWLGEKDRLAKFQNIYLSETDVINFDDMFFRIAASDEKYRKQVPYFTQQAQNKTGPAAKWGNFRYVPYPKVSVMEWKTMTPFERANYVVTFRQLWQDARTVLKQKEARDRAKSKNKKTSQLQLPASAEDFFSLLFNLNVATAQASGDDSELLGGPDGDADVPPRRGRTAGGEGRVSSPGSISVAQRGDAFTGDTCIVAGYVSVYANNSCTVQTIDAAYNNSNNTLYQRAKAFCDQNHSGTMACNPYVYGAPGGQPICVTPSRSNQEFQRASSWDGPCDDGSQLSTNRQGSIGQTSGHRGRYANLMSPEERRRTFGQAQRVEGGASNFALTEQYLYGVLRLRGMISESASSDMTLNQNNLNDDILRQIARDRDTFESEIRAATQSCMAEASTSNDNPRVERNYWDACDQLHRRFLMVNELFAEKCGGMDKLDTATLKCRCEGTTNTVIPGAECTAATADAGPPVPPASAGSQPEQPAATTTTRDCEEELPGSTLVGGQCVCPGGGAPEVDRTSGSRQCSGAPGRAQTGDDDDGCGFMCGVGRFLRGAVPWIVAGIATYFLVRMLAPKKPELQAPQDRCANGTVPPCVQQCTPPLALQSNGTCACAACPPGQTANATTCVCATPTTGGGTTNSYTCPDMSIVTGANESEALAKCPTYPCWNGQTYQNPMNCPPPAATTTTTPPPLPPPSGTR